MNKPLVSVIIPCYNAEKYVEDGKECGIEKGIEYVELSSTEVVRDPNFLAKIHEIMPRIEAFWAAKGKKIKILFLAAIARDAIQEKKEDEFVGGLPFYGRKLLGNKVWIGVFLKRKKTENFLKTLRK